jgi:hypothetical protein
MGTLRTKIETLINNLPTVFPDNNSGIITPAVLRDYLNQLLQSLFLPDARLLKVAGPVAIPLTTAFTLIPNTLWGTAVFDASGDVSAIVATGRVIAHPTINDLSYVPSAQITGEGPVNTQFDFSFGVNGVTPTIVLGSLTTQGAGRDVNIEMSEMFNSLNANDYVQLYARAPAGAATLTVSYVRLNLIGWMTYN